MKLNSTLLKSTGVATLGGLLFGFDTVVISGAIQPLENLYHLTPFWKGFTVAAALIGTVIGSMLAGIPGDRLGRRASLRWMAILYVVSAAGCAFAWNWSAVLLFRFIGGLGIGGSSVLGPMYIAEIAPAGAESVQLNGQLSSHASKASGGGSSFTARSSSSRNATRRWISATIS